METQNNFQEEEEVLLMENGDSYFQLKQQKIVTSANPSNNGSRFQGTKGYMPSNNWESQNGRPYQPFNNGNNGRTLNKENMRSRSRSQGRDQSGDNQRRPPYRNNDRFGNNERFDSRQQGFNPRFNQGQRDHSHGNQNYQNQRFNSHNRDNRDHRDHRDNRDNRGDNRTEGRIFKPTLEGPLKSFRQFMESQRNDVDPSQAEKVYNQYKQEYEEKQDKIFFTEHRNDEWFKEKYDKTLAEKFLEEKREESRMNAERLIINFREGVYDGLNLDYEEYGHKHLLSEQNSGQTEEDKDNNGFTEVGIDNEHDITSAPFFGYNPGSRTLFIKAVPKFVSRWDLTEALQKLDGYLSLSMSEPLKNQDFNRLGWILFDNETNCNIACEHLKTLNIKGHAFVIFKAKFQQKTLKICENMNEEAVNTHLQLSRKLIEALDNEKDIRTGELLKFDYEVNPEKQLDLQILYLRKVHSYCFYCASEYTDERILASKCGPIHLRRQKLGKETPRPDLPDWHKRLGDLINQRIQESAKKQKLSQENIEQEAEKEFDEYIKTLCQNLSKQGNWPCKFCPKIFKEDHFVVKHIKTKHPEQLQQLKEKKMCESFRSDKNKLNTTFNGGHQSHSNHSRPQGQSGSRPQNNNFRQDRTREYKDLDDPRVSQVRTSRPVISYGDL